ncbi:MAG: hypothetical protein K2Z81_02920 [Cyanobacteria bacterium]|nr:hypothetical protein [Cyanobacteriota bacterium]
MKRILLAMALMLAVPASQARVGPISLREQTRAASDIAIVNVTNVRTGAGAKGDHWTYDTASEAVVEKSIKGNLSGKVILYGGEDFECACHNFPKGRALVFLLRDKDLLTGAGWFCATLPIEGGKLKWFSSPDSLRTDKLVTVDKALKELQKLLNEPQPVLKKGTAR